MIITRLLGGLGNQMFQYAAGLALAHKRRTVLKLDVSWFREHAEYEDHNRYGLSCFNVTEQFATKEEIDHLRGINLTRSERWSLKIAQALRFRQYSNYYASGGNFHSARSFRFYPEFFSQPDGTYLEGMWQTEKFFVSVSNLIRLHFSFRYPPQPAVAEMASRIQSGPSAAIHFRRGDYVRNPTFNKELGLIGMDYYYRAIKMLHERHPNVTLYIFSDDIDAVEREFKPTGPHVFVRVTQPWHAYDKIRLISLCQHVVIANSTFSWWGAWLNPSPEKIVIAPDPWFSDSEHDGSDLVPESWTRIPRS